MAKFELYRFIETMDIEDVALKNRGDYNVIDSGEWVSPSNFNGHNAEYSRATSAELTDNIKRLSRLVWMEKGRTDARAVGKISVIFGDGTRAKTDIFKSGDPIVEGDLLTIKVEDDNTSENFNKVVLAKAGNNDVVKGVCLVAPSHDPEGLLHFALKD